MTLDSEQADLEYNPRLRVAGFAQYFSRWRQQSEQARSELVWRELSYGSSAAERIDFFPARRSQAPLLIFLHGGYWRVLDKRDFSWIAPAYVAAGAAVAIVNYGLAPGTPIESIVLQVRGAVSWLAARAPELHGNGRMIISGHSAGAHLSAMMLTIPSGIHGAVSLSGIFDLRPLVKAPFLSDLQLSEERATLLSPLFSPPVGSRPLLLAVGDAESDEFHRQSEALKSAWSHHVDGTGTAYPVTGPMRLPERDHFSICDSLVDPVSPLFQATCSLLDP